MLTGLQPGTMSCMAGKRVVVVTGASRGAGRGIALGLAQDSIVYVTGRTVEPGILMDGEPSLSDDGHTQPGSLNDTVEQINAAGGEGVAVAVDHSDNDQVKELFDRVSTDHGKLDILVNNATALARPPGPTPFWERALDLELRPLTVGARSHYVATHYAASIMTAAGKGLIVNTSSPGAAVHIAGLHGVTYGMGKSASDKMIHECAHDLQPFGVTAISLWMGVLWTEKLLQIKEAFPDFFTDFANDYEYPELSGRVIDALWHEENLIERTGKAWYGAELARELGVTDIDGRQPESTREWMGGPLDFRSVPGTWAEFVKQRDAADDE